MKNLDCKVGIHCHNDIGMVVANSVISVSAGATHIQGTFLGIGERCGNANLSSIIPTLKLKLDYDVISKENLKKLTGIGILIFEISNISLKDETHYIGASTFSYKGGMYINVVCKDSKSYEHIDPEIVGNNRRFLISEVSGKNTILKDFQKIFSNLQKNREEVINVTEELKKLEYEGYKFEGAGGTVELVIRKILINVDGKEEISAALGDGPVNALDKAL